MTRRSLLRLAFSSGALLSCAATRLPGGKPLTPVLDKQPWGLSRRVPGAGPGLGVRGVGGTPKRLIQTGWGHPDPGFLRWHIAHMERQPFDGCVFHLNDGRSDGASVGFSWEAWGRRRFSATELEPALRDLQAVGRRRFSHNFLRFNVTPGDVDWFDDFSAIIANARLAGWLAREGGTAGILLEPEQYEFPLFDYREQRRASTVSWEAYADQARRRGEEVMAAFQEGYPDLTLFLAFAYSQPWWDSQAGRRPLAECHYGLLAPFLDGVVAAASERGRLVEGWELAFYHNQVTGWFARAYRMVRQDLLPIVRDPAKYLRLLSVGFGLWLDLDSQRRGWDGVDAERNYYSPAAFERSVRAALEVADEYVWIYTQIPRWWSAEGPPVNLPAGYSDALRRARQDPIP